MRRGESIASMIMARQWRLTKPTGCKPLCCAAIQGPHRACVGLFGLFKYWHTKKRLDPPGMEQHHTQGEEHGEEYAQSLGTIDCRHHLPGDDCKLAVWLDAVCPADERGPRLGYCRDPDCVQ